MHDKKQGVLYLQLRQKIQKHHHRYTKLECGEVLLHHLQRITFKPFTSLLGENAIPPNSIRV